MRIHGASAAAMIVALWSAPLMAQTAPSVSTPPQAALDEAAPAEVVLTGYRAALRGALDEKKHAGIIVDAINAEDIADFLGLNPAESLRRLPGISIDRYNGEVRTISVRDLSGGFSRIRISGMETLSTSGANNANGSPNRSRSFDFNAFASKLFSPLRACKSS